jgi:hypothetical protein
MTQIQRRQATTVGTNVGIKNITLIQLVPFTFFEFRKIEIQIAIRVVIGTPIIIM